MKAMDVPSIQKRCKQPRWWRYAKQWVHYAFYYFRKAPRKHWPEFFASAARVTNNNLLIEDALSKAKDDKEYKKILNGIMQQAGNAFIDHGRN